MRKNLSHTNELDQASMTLTAEQKQLFARHLLLPEVGADGQLRLCEAKFDDVEELTPYANEIRGEYLSRAGMKQGQGLVPEAESDPNVVPELVVATAYLQGSLSAVESIKAALALPLSGGNP